MGSFAARWSVAQALAEDCDLILHENSDTLETRTFAKTMNGIVDLKIRGMFFGRICDLAAMYGILIFASWLHLSARTGVRDPVTTMCPTSRI